MKVKKFAFWSAAAVLLISLPAYAAFNSLMLTGLAEQGNIFYGRTSPDAVVMVGIDEVPVSDDGWFVFGISRDAPETLEIVSVDEEGVELKRLVKIKQVEWSEWSEDNFPPRMVTPDEKDMGDIVKDSDAIKIARNIVTTENFPECFIMPIENAEISLDFGVSRIMNGIPKSYHSGVDFSAEEGTPVKATADGIVTHINMNSYYNGKMIIINHGYGISSTYAHLSKTDVSIGQKVAAGDKIGEVGSTGRSLYPHLHFGLHYRLIPVSPVKAILITKNNCNK